MKIVIIRLNVGDFGKIGTYNVQEVGLANALIAKGHDVSVLFLHKETDKIIQDDRYDFVYYLPHKSIGLHGIFKVDILKQFSPDRVIIFSDNQLWAKNVIYWCKKRNIDCIHYFGAVLSNNSFWLNQLYTKLILLRNKKSYNYSINVAKTKEVESELRKHKISCKRVINIGLDDELLEKTRNLDNSCRKELGLSEDELILLFIGRLSDDKRPLASLPVLNALIRRGVNAKLIIIGKGGLADELSQLTARLNLLDSVIRVETVPYKDIYKYMVSCDCCINMSHVEIFGMTILESMYYGLPIVAHAAPGPNEIIENGVSGMLCDTDNPEIWAEKILEAVNRRQDISVAAHKRIEQKFTWNSIATEFINVID